ncbi:MAG TPA: GDP-L-fucose synthase [Bacteroidales bacterium]|nr:GDP-L-fucose synthase [Bacteroidales bacterium]
MNKTSKIYIAGHNGMVGSAITRNLKENGFTNLVYTPYPPFDLTDQHVVADFFKTEKPEYVFLAAAKVGGIVANNKYRAQFIYENLMIENNIIHQSYLNGVKKLLFLGSSCIYPKNCPQPIKEEYLLTGDLEYTNEPYAIAKIAGIKMCESYNIQYGTNFISVMPTNLYGLNDNYNLETSHVLPALIRKMHLGKCLENNDWEGIRNDFNKYPVEGVAGNSDMSEIVTILEKYGIKKDSQKVTITLWGTGSPFREFLHVDDVAHACVFLMNKVDFKNLISDNTPVKNTHINIGTGKDLTIKELANLIKRITGFRGEIMWDLSKPDGTPRKLLDVSKLNLLGWKEKVDLDNGINKVYNHYLS